MIQKYIVRSVIAPVVVAGILIIAILAGISFNQALAYSNYKSYKGHHGYYKSSKYTRHENLQATKTVTTGNGGNNENAAQGSSNTQRECKPTITLNVSPATTGASSYQLKGRLTCGDSGLSGKTIILTSTHVSYFGRIASAVTGPEGTFSATTTKALTEASAWYNALGKHIDLAGGTPQGVSNNENAAQAGSNGNTQQGVSNTEQGAPSNNGGQCKSAITQLSAVYYPPYRNWKISGELTCGGTGLSGKTIILTNSKLSYVGKLGTVVTGATGLGGQGFFVISSIKPTATTAKPASTLSAWYLGGPDEGGIASKTITLPQLTAEQTFAKPTPQTMEEKGASNNG